MDTGNFEAIQSRVGTTLGGKYRLDRLLGVGGMGAVFEAENTWTGRRVAIKLMLGEMTKHGELVARFMREARAASRVSHPHIVQVLDLGQDPTDGALYIVQEYLEGEDLARYLESRGKLQTLEALGIMTPVMSALAAAHAEGIVHRDIKPENIFLTRTAGGLHSPRLIDFGIAKVSDASNPGLGLTRTGTAMGTPFYMSPEQARGQKAIDAQTDVWAIGVVLFEVLTGAKPWKSENYNALIVEILSDPIPRIDSLVPSVPRAVADVIDRALQRERHARFATMDAFLEALLATGDYGREPWHAALSASRPRGIDSQPAAAIPHAATLPSGQSPAAPDAIVIARPSSTTLGASAREITTAPAERSRSRAWLVGAAALLLVGAGGAFFASRPAHTTTLPAPPTSAASSAATSAASSAATSAAPEPSPTFVVSVTARPASAEITLDGESTHANSIARAFPRDGRSHLLEVRAAGFEPARVAFTDAPPQASIELAPLAPTGAAAIVPAPSLSTRSAVTHTTASSRTFRSGAASERAPAAHTETAVSAPSPRTGANQAPILSE